MSNRRKPRMDRSRTPRCPRCKCRDFLTKRGGYNVHVCQRCEHIWPAEPAQEGGDA